MNARIYFISGVVGAVVLAYFIGGHVGYKNAVADYSVEAAEAAQIAKDKQAVEQIAVNDLADQFYRAVQNENERSMQLEEVKRELRKSNSRACSGSDNPYILYNKTANSKYLPENKRTRLPDAEKDSLDAVQIGVEEYNKAAIQVNKLIDIIASSECFKQK